MNPKQKSRMFMRCARGCGAITRPSSPVKNLEELEADAIKKGFVKIDKLFFCPRCAAKQK